MATAKVYTNKICHMYFFFDYSEFPANWLRLIVNFNVLKERFSSFFLSA